MTRAAFLRFHGQYRDRLLVSMMKYTRNIAEAEDIATSAWTAAFEKRRDFRGEACFFTWIYRIGLNLISSASRRKKAVPLDAMEGCEFESLVDDRDLLDEMLFRGECCRQLRKAFRRVPLIYRQVLTDHFVRGWPVRKKIGSNSRIPLGTVLSRLHKAKSILRVAYLSCNNAVL